MSNEIALLVFLSFLAGFGLTVFVISKRRSTTNDQPATQLLSLINDLRREIQESIPHQQDRH